MKLGLAFGKVANGIIAATINGKKTPLLILKGGFSTTLMATLLLGDPITMMSTS